MRPKEVVIDLFEKQYGTARQGAILLRYIDRGNGDIPEARRRLNNIKIIMHAGNVSALMTIYDTLTDTDKVTCKNTIKNLQQQIKTIEGEK